MCRVVSTLAQVIAFLAMTTIACAELLYYDPFLIGTNPLAGEYSLGQLAGQNPLIGPTPFFGGAWEGASVDVNDTVVQTQGLTYLDAPVAGGSLIVSLDENNLPVSRTGRRLTTPFTATTVGTYYMSFLANFGGVGIDPASTSRDDVAHRAIEMWTDSGFIGNDADLVFRIGYMSYNGNFNNLTPSQAPLRAGPFGQEVILGGGPASFAADNGSTHLIVLKFNLSDQPLSDEVELFVNPTDIEEPVIVSAAFIDLDFTLGAVSGPVQFGGTGTSMQFDEIRVGTEFADVVPTGPAFGPCSEPDEECYITIVQHMHMTGAHRFEGDVNADGRVDLYDLRIWRDNRTDIPAILAAIPEPFGAALMALGLTLVSLSRQRLFHVNCISVDLRLRP
jgi:hypothetical protein